MNTIKRERAYFRKQKYTSVTIRLEKPIINMKLKCYYITFQYKLLDVF